MFRVGRYYMHERSLDSCVKVIRHLSGSKYQVIWYNVSCSGSPFAFDGTKDRIHLSSFWHDITVHRNTPRAEWPEELKLKLRRTA